MSEELVRKLVKDLGGEVTEVGRLPDGSGFATASLPLPKDHWLYEDGVTFFIANASGECDTCHTAENVPVYREDTDEGWQECIDCDARRYARKEMRRAS